MYSMLNFFFQHATQLQYNSDLFNIDGRAMLGEKVQPSHFKVGHSEKYHVVVERIKSI
jgi:hypothetical protein